MIPFIFNVQNRQHYLDRKWILRLPKFRSIKGEMEVTANRYSISFWGDEVF